MSAGNNWNRRVAGEPETEPLSRRPSKYLIFLSYSSRDSWTAGKLKEKLEMLGAEVWMDSGEIAGGDMTVDSLLRTIDACDEAVILLSPGSEMSKWVHFEMGAVVGQHKRLTAVLSHERAGTLPIFPGLSALLLEHADELLTRVKQEVARSEGGGNRRAAALRLRGSLSPEEATQLREETRRLRETWR